MDLTKFIVFDLEGDGLDPTKIHCLAIAYFVDGELVVKSTTNYNTMRKILTKEEGIYVGHNIINWDIPAAVEKILGIEVKGKCIDTLYLSWYLYPDMRKHGLEGWGEHFGIAKPKIDDWHNLTKQEYIHRCEEDVKINIRLWVKQYKQLLKIYGSKEEANRLIDYLMFKAQCVTSQLKSRWKLDVEKCINTLEDFKAKKEVKTLELLEAMPKIPVIRVRNYPKTLRKVDGNYSVAGQAWVDLLKERGLPEDHTEPISYIHSYTDPNPNSTQQIKKWLYDLGWKPTTFKYIKEEDGTRRKVEQVREEGVLCPSVKRLFKKEPRLVALEGLTVLSHRIAMLQGFLDAASPDGYIRAEVQGITNTLRFRHKVAVNLPGVTGSGGIEDGAHIRGCLTAPEGYELCGSDMSSLEDRIKQHFMWDYDPEYVKEMMVTDFDPHMSLAIFAGALTQEDVDLFHSVKKKKKNDEQITDEEKKRFDHISKVRHEYKTTNYAAQYGTGAETLSINLGISKGKAAKIIEAYWGRNWAVKKVAERCTVKEVDGQKWLLNPICNFWYSLRAEKDRFSTLCQGGGVYCFDTWIRYFMSKRHQLTGQFHDEIIITVQKGNRDKCEKLLRWAIKQANKELKLNRELDVDVQFGTYYSDIH
jgi:DNA polymerase I-like protein with 3'-5' exonuclease and polymerase domains